MKANLGRIICLVALTAGLGVGARAQQQEADTVEQFWPEVDVFVRLSPKFRLFFLGTVTKAKETRDNTEAQFGAHVDYFLHKKVTLRTGYRYGFSLNDSDPFKEHRIIIEQTFRQPLPFDILLSDRNREDLRWVNGDFSARYRNRVTLEREFKVFKRAITPYISGEIYYDSRYNTWNRNRFAVGVQIPFKKGLPLITLVHPERQFVLDIYYLRQNDSRSHPNHVNGIGTVFNIYF